MHLEPAYSAGWTLAGEPHCVVCYAHPAMSSLLPFWGVKAPTELANQMLDAYARSARAGAFPTMIDTDPTMLARYLDLVQSIPKPERLARAIALSALVREMAWQGAMRHSGHLGAEAVVERFLMQLYGTETGREMSLLLRRAERVSYTA